MRGSKIGLASAEVVLEAALVLGQRRHEGRGGGVQHVRLVRHLPGPDLCTGHQASGHPAERQHMMWWRLTGYIGGRQATSEVCATQGASDRATFLAKYLHEQSLKRDDKDTAQLHGVGRPRPACVAHRHLPWATNSMQFL